MRGKLELSQQRRRDLPERAEKRKEERSERNIDEKCIQRREGHLAGAEEHRVGEQNLHQIQQADRPSGDAP